jgi:hypothetical protein
MYGPGSEAKIKASEKDFREKLQIQIHQLLGVKPRIEFDRNNVDYII